MGSGLPFKDLSSGSGRPYWDRFGCVKSTSIGNCLDRSVEWVLDSFGGASTGATKTTLSPTSSELSPIEGAATANVASASALTTTPPYPIAITDAGLTKQTYLYDAIFLRRTTSSTAYYLSTWITSRNVQFPRWRLANSKIICFQYYDN